MEGIKELQIKQKNIEESKNIDIEYLSSSIVFSFLWQRHDHIGPKLYFYTLNDIKMVIWKFEACNASTF